MMQTAMKPKGKTQNGSTFAEPIVGINKEENELLEITYIRLYLYVKPESLIPLLSSKRIHLSKPWNTNDVTECVQQNKETQSEEIKGYGYICLSCRCDSSAMWGYYADSSKGACLAFDFPVEKIKKGQYRLLDDNYTVEKASKIIRAVEYRENRFKGNDTLSLLHRKAIEWAHEEEYRIAIPLEQAQYETSENYTNICFYNNIIFKHLSHIILGVHSPHECSNIKAILQTLNISNVNVTRAVFSPQSFSYLIPDTIYSLEQHQISGSYSYIFNNKLTEWSQLDMNRPGDIAKIVAKNLSEMESLSGCYLTSYKLAFVNIFSYQFHNHIFIVAEIISSNDKISHECFLLYNGIIKKMVGLTTEAKEKIKNIIEHCFH